jgi:hypothetical protein
VGPAGLVAGEAAGLAAAAVAGDEGDEGVGGVADACGDSWCPQTSRLGERSLPSSAGVKPYLGLDQLQPEKSLLLVHLHAYRQLERVPVWPLVTPPLLSRGPTGESVAVCASALYSAASLVTAAV